MAQQQWVAPVNAGAPWQTASGTTLNTAATATLSPEGAGGTGADPQVFSFYQGMVVRIKARGVYTMGSTATNATFALYASASGTAAASGTSLATTGALALPVSVTGLTWRIDAAIQVRAMAQGTGTATLYTHGDLHHPDSRAVGYYRQHADVANAGDVRPDRSRRGHHDHAHDRPGRHLVAGDWFPDDHLYLFRG